MKKVLSFGLGVVGLGLSFVLNGNVAFADSNVSDSIAIDLNDMDSSTSKDFFDEDGNYLGTLSVEEEPNNLPGGILLSRCYFFIM